MPKQLLLYELPTPVTPQRHGDWSVGPGTRYRFAAGVTAVPLMAAEFVQSAPHLPIVFSVEGETVLPVAVVGIKTGENLFVDTEGNWTAPVVPAFLRRYPFVFSTGADATTMTLCIDEAFEGIDRKGQSGERMFDDAGNRTPFLDNALNFVTGFQQEHNRSVAFGNRLRALGLLETGQAKLTLEDGAEQVVNGFMMVSREKLGQLGDAETLELARSGALELIHLHLLSLTGFGGLARQAIARDKAKAAAVAA